MKKALDVDFIMPPTLPARGDNPLRNQRSERLRRDSELRCNAPRSQTSSLAASLPTKPLVPAITAGCYAPSEASLITC
jgi:hypothetical protein